ncbi:MAG: hypothetical protein V1690_03210 [Candidatus Moraniibacteriota bacterium]
MTKVKQKRVLILATCFLIVGMGFVFLAGTTQAELAPGSVKLDDDPAGLGKLINSAVPPNPFNSPGEQDKEIKLVPAFQENPLADYAISFDKSNDKNFQKGGVVNLAGDLSYSGSQAKNQIDKARENCLSRYNNKSEAERNQLCASPEIYQIPSIPDAGIFVQAWRRDETENRTKTGDYLIDEFYAAQGLTLKEGKNHNVNIIWKIPEELKTGSYYFSFFVTANQRFPLSGFPINVFSPGIVYPFDISGDSGNGVEIDKNKIKINDTAYSPVLPVPTVEPKDGKVTIEASVANLNPAEQKVTVRYELYRWMQEDPKNLLTKEEQAETITPGEIKTTDFSFTPSGIESVYTVKVVASTPKSQSVIDIHFSLKDKNKGIFLFLGAAKGSDNNFYPMFCPRDAQWVGMFPAEIKLTLSKNNKDIASWDKKGIIEPVDGRCIVIQDEKFKEMGSGNCMKLTGQIFNPDNKLVDETTIDYNCGPKDSGDSDAGLLSQKKQTFTDKNIIIAFLGLLILTVIGGMIILINKNKIKIDE